MNFSTTLLFYLLLGGAVAVAVHLSAECEAGRERWFRSLTAVIFWPIYLPGLLQRTASGFAESEGPAGLSQKTISRDSGTPDEIAAAIGQVEAELDLALRSLGGWYDAVLAREEHRFAELRAAWHTQAEKIRELDRLLNQPAFAEVASPPSQSSSGRVVHSEQARRENIDRLRAVRARLHDDLRSTLAWVRELVTMIHLAKFTGAPASRAEELVMQIATSVEGLSEVAAWRE